MYIVTAKEMYDIDHYTMHEIGMDGRLLMENAGRAVSDKVMGIVGSHDRISVFVGPGNNGGDGFVIARTLLDKGYDVQVIQIVSDEKIRGDALYHKSLFHKCDGKVICERQTSAIRKIVELSDVVIDSMLGIGVEGDLKPPFSEVVSVINQSNVCVISVDIPTGLPAGEHSASFTSIIADYTFAVGAAKESAFLEETASYYGKWETLAIGFPQQAFHKFADRSLWTEKDFKKTLPTRKKYAHKGNHGKGLLIGGNRQMPGAIAMSTKAALKAGGGLITAGTTEEVISMIAPLCQEAMFMKLGDNDGHLVIDQDLPIESFDAIALGIGMGRREETGDLVRHVIQKAHCPIIVDADGLYHVRNSLHALKERTYPAIITPHPGEMAMLMDLPVGELLSAPFRYTHEFAKEYGVYVVLKGKNTIITSPFGIQVVETSGNPGLAKGGSGDVLTGIALAMIMQEQSIIEAVCNACFIHGKSADIQVEQAHSFYDLLATDVIDGISKVYRTFS
ncbi:bifunctional ADP-dependent NAD(P)H-hydrate dehydratase/NAD(P)H-hydrate epimerase [Oceanobacillus damuensis]|uniref:bifunctional ADP-dependent NAD(P)H-hydrate dehydratase/NAD(P)H-hydrate epimerase n=1 Tax=Oceanobacillus damuensis TaxID=937928 RepID=UPI000829F35F|nr:bifunctional ADP-dependent NAD(P)H-hydrate dehydratase/NAD(P)H-hydrate epimerase [Oceanobacillus damuensis]